MNILLIGNGAREHAIAEALTKTGRAKLATYAKARNPGIASLSDVYELGSYTDFDAILDFAKKVRPDFAFIGPDDPIADGVADALLELEIHSVAPLKTVARLESSKSFTRDLLEKYKIPGNPRFRVFLEKSSGIRGFLNELEEGNYVVKADGLMGGKGVKVAGDHLYSIDEAVKYAEECIDKFGRVVIEEKLIGQEFSLMSFVDGKNVVDMPPVQDHKRAFVDDLGENTGGMGSYSDANHLLPFLKKRDLELAHEITVRTAAALHEETGVMFKGIMYGGFIAVKDGVRLIEFNARFGDPEAMNVLPILKTDFLEVCEGILRGNLNRVKVEFERKATVCKYIVPEGYPANPKPGRIVIARSVEQNQSATKQSNLRMYYASVDQRPDGLYLSSSRAIAFVGIADDLVSAERLAEGAVGSVKGPVFYRKDVGTAALIEKRVRMMRELRV